MARLVERTPAGKVFAAKPRYVSHAWRLAFGEQVFSALERFGDDGQLLLNAHIRNEGAFRRVGERGEKVIELDQVTVGVDDSGLSEKIDLSELDPELIQRLRALGYIK